MNRIVKQSPKLKVNDCRIINKINGLAKIPPKRKMRDGFRE